MRLSEHFVESEFRCRHCARVRVVPELVWRLEHLRAQVGLPLIILSAFRCPTHNAEVGGAKGSRHLLGEAVDIATGYARVSQAAHAGFNGIGRSNGWAVHLDVRPTPARWDYPPRRRSR